jgi:hypothetical protein
VTRPIPEIQGLILVIRPIPEIQGQNLVTRLIPKIRGPILVTRLIPRNRYQSLALRGISLTIPVIPRVHRFSLSNPGYWQVKKGIAKVIQAVR